MTAVLFAGLLAGLVHVVSGPDHLAAVAPLAAEGRGRRWAAGFFWGVGHTGGVWVVGALAFFLREFIPVELLSHWSERLVGVVLVGIGLWGFRRVFCHRLHAHEHVHGGERHVHVHLHDAETAHAHEVSSTHRHTHAALAVGGLHGLAGTSHLLGVLPALALPTLAASAAYIGAFGAGSILAMTLFSTVVGTLAGRFSLGGARVYRGLLAALSTAAVGVGVVWLLS
jgi:hypothetical protein